MSFSSPSYSAASSSSNSTNKRSRLGPTTSRKKPIQRSPFPSFGSYMAEKNRKLREQFDADASTSSVGVSGDSAGGEGIFRGISIFVDGFTVPSNQELKAFMLKHGGRFENYFSRQRVTHIVCSNLPDSKMKNLRAFSRGLPVVKPEWILDSVAANKVLSWTPYQLCELVNETGKQQKLSSFFVRKSIPSLGNSDHFQDSNAKLDAQGSDATEELCPPGDDNFSESGRQENVESGSLGLETVNEEGKAYPRFADLEDEHSVMEASDSSPDRHSHMINNIHMDNINCLDSSLSEAPKQHHSTLGDPNFVENYFKNSRLHFIGTWRNRYRKRFHNMKSEGKHNSANVISASGSRKSWVIHIDMDSFFVSVVIRNFPELGVKPVAVCHSDNPKGTAEISSANYPAREYGIRAGMFVRDAKARCPDLIIVPYDFEAYEEVADQLYSILHKHCSNVQAVSCDEAFLDATECVNNDPEHLASMVRKEIAETTRCTASAGIAENMLLARMATKTAKPNGQCFISPEKVDSYLKDLPVSALPGIGHSIGEKLKNKQINSCSQLRLISKEALHKDFGIKTGDMLWNYCRGIDHRAVEAVQEIKSVGAEVNWGVRFNEIGEFEHFLLNLCKEVSLRLEECGVVGRTITLKMKKRRKGAGEPTKFMGCGDCENLSRSMTLPVATGETILLERIAKQIFASFHIDVKDIRGVGLQMSRLELTDSSRKGREKNALKQWLASYGRPREDGKEAPCAVNRAGTAEPQKLLYRGVDQHGGSPQPCSKETLSSRPVYVKQSSTGSYECRTSTLPALCHLDIEVIKNLPPEIFSEINAMYNGELSSFLESYIEKDSKSVAALSGETTPVENRILCSYDSQKLHPDGEGIGSMITRQLSPAGPSLDRRNKGKGPICLTSADIGEAVDGDQTDDANTLYECFSGTVPDTEKSERAQSAIGNDPDGSLNRLLSTRNVQNCDKTRTNLWLGNPPSWVQMYKFSDCLLLNIVAEMYTKARRSCNLSCILQSLFSSCPLNFDLMSEGWDEAHSSLCELITQYIDLKIESDIEELYICFRMLRRFASVSKLFVQVYNIVLPPLQVSVNEHYGGHLHLSFIE